RGAWPRARGDRAPGHGQRPTGWLQDSLAEPGGGVPGPGRAERGVSTRRVAWATARLEFQLMARDRLFVALTILAAVSFVAMVSLFGLTGSRAPMALIDQGGGQQARRFISAMDRAYHSFRLRPMSR